MGYGIIGGPLTSFRLQGIRAAEVAIEILKGAKAAEIAFDYGMGTLVNVYDWRKLQRWDIDEGILPQDSTVLFRKPTVWELYKAQATGVLSLIIFESALIMALFINLQRRKRAEIFSRASRFCIETI